MPTFKIKELLLLFYLLFLKSLNHRTNTRHFTSQPWSMTSILWRVSTLASLSCVLWSQSCRILHISKYKFFQRDVKCLFFFSSILVQQCFNERQMQLLLSLTHIFILLCNFPRDVNPLFGYREIMHLAHWKKRTWDLHPLTVISRAHPEHPG